MIPSLAGGGAEQQLAALANELAGRGAEVHVGFIHDGPNLARIDRTRVRTHQLRCAGNHDPFLILRAAQLVRQIRPAVVQTWLPQMDVVGGLAARLNRVPHVLSERSSAIAYPNTWKNRLRSWIGSGARVVVANSGGGAEYWRSHNPGLPTAVVRNGVRQDIGVARTLTSEGDRALAAHSRIILVAGRLNSEKNLSRLLAAIDIVLAGRADCTALLFGDGPLRETLTAQIAGLACRERVLLRSYTDELVAWMKNADVFVSVSLFEGNPNAVVEAMAVGCPLVASAIPQHRELLDASSAVFCNPHSVDDIASSVAACLDDRAAAEARAQAARSLAAPWTLAATAMAYFRIYEQVLGLNGGQIT